jgi:hypothetical protein
MNHMGLATVHTLLGQALSLWRQRENEQTTYRSLKAPLQPGLPAAGETLKGGQVGGTEQEDQERREGPLTILTSYSDLHVTCSQRGIENANFISLDPSSFGLQQAGGRKQS